MRREVVSLVALLLLPLSCVAAQFYNVQFLPERPTIGQQVVARVAEIPESHCLRPGRATNEGPSIVLELAYSDYCELQPFAYHDYPLGRFLPGVYYFTIEACVSNPPPFPSGCTRYFISTLRVDPTIGSVPLMSLWAFGSLLFGLIVLAARESLRSEHRPPAGTQA